MEKFIGEIVAGLTAAGVAAIALFALIVSDASRKAKAAFVAGAAIVAAVLVGVAERIS